MGEQRDRVFSRVAAYSLVDGRLVKEFDKVPDAVEWLKAKGFAKAHQRSISRCCRGERKSAYQYSWEYTTLGSRMPDGMTMDDYDKTLRRAWIHMKERKADGIEVYEDWESFPHFQDWAMGQGYREGLFLRRKDSKRGYFPDNCELVEPLVGRSDIQPARQKRIKRVDEDGVETVYPSLIEAAAALVEEGRGNRYGKIENTAKNISCSALRKTSIAYGSVWTYLDD